MSTQDVDLRRLARAVYLDVQGMGPGRYQVSGGAEPHSVLTQGDGWGCDCADFQFARGACKHTLAVRLVSGDPTLIESLRLLIPYPRPHRKAVAR